MIEATFTGITQYMAPSCESLSQLTICMAYVVSMYKSIYTAMHISQLGH